MSNVPSRWLELAEYDLETARAMLDSGRYNYVYFCSQQSIEKALKAVIADRTKTTPPRSHNLLRLAEVANVTLENPLKSLCELLTGFYVHSRYPEEMTTSNPTQAEANEVYKNTEEAIRWLSSLMKSS